MKPFHAFAAVFPLLLSAVAGAAAPIQSKAGQGTASAAPGPVIGTPAAAPQQTSAAPAADLPPLTPAQLQSIDETLRKQESQVRLLESIAGGAADGSGCPATASLTAFRGELTLQLQAPPTTAGASVFSTIVRSVAYEDVVDYYVCSAAAQNNPNLCADLRVPRTAGGANVPEDIDAECREFAHLIPVWRAYDNRSPTAVDLCVADLQRHAAEPDGPKFKSPDAVRRICAAFASYSGDPAPFAAAVAAATTSPMDPGMVQRGLYQLVGDPRAFTRRSVPAMRNIVKANQEYQRFLQSKDKSDCRSGLCRVLAGESAAACEPYLNRARGLSCRAYFGPREVTDVSAQYQKGFDETFLLVSKAGLGSKAEVVASEKRLDSLFALRKRYEAAAATIAARARTAQDEVKAQGAPVKKPSDAKASE